MQRGIVFGNTTSTKQGIRDVLTKEMKGMGSEQAAKAAMRLVHRSAVANKHRSAVANNAKHDGVFTMEGFLMI